MPLSEFLRMARGQIESDQQKSCPTNLSSRSDDELVELVWENGQIMMQGQSSRVARSPPRKSRDVVLGNSRVGKFGVVESVLNDISPIVPSEDLDFDQDDEIVPWLNYPIEDAMPQEYVSSQFPEISSVTANGMSAQNSILSADKRSSCGQNVSNNSNLMNFSHFSRPATKRQFPNFGAIPTVSPASGSNPVKSSFVEGTDFHVSPVFKGDKGLCPTERSKNLCRENSIKNEKAVIQSNQEPRTVEPVVATSSVGSGNSADRVSCEQTRHSKRKFRDVEESDCHSDDIDTESVGVKKPSRARGGAGSKRSRAAEVHNLSERRRRDRINEKMRALQELIPNCNKADKASMLDEAIEYLKTLQIQVQIMSMGAGLCMPQMMFPTAMHPAHYPPMGMGMGMGMGFGMDMIEINGRSSGYPIFPPPPMHLANFPSPISGPTNFQRMPGPNFPVYVHPSQAQPPTTPIPKSRDQAANMNSSPLMCNAEASTSVNRKSDQMRATNEVLKQSAAVQDNRRGTDASGTTDVTSTTATDIGKKPG